jgi:tetratricopeptide (TPR) repeat protein
VEAALAERVRALLEGVATGNTNVPFAVRRSAVGGGDPQPGAKRMPPPQAEQSRSDRGGRWWAVALGLVGLVAFVVVRYWPRPATPGAPQAVASKPGAAPVKAKPGAASRNPEVRQLIAKATTLWEKWDEAARADWTLAEELCQRAVELDPADGEAWAIFAQVTFGRHEFFHEAGADDLVRERAERAVRLQPASKNARLAMANAYRTNSRTLPEAERILRQLVANTPEDKRMLRTLGDTLRDRKKYQEAMTFYDQAAALPGGDHLALLAKSFALELLGRYEEAEGAVDAALAVRRGSAAMLRKVDCRLNFHGDLEGAARMLARVPAAALLDDRAVSLACQLWLWKRTPDNSLDLLNSFNRDFLQGYYWAGAPKHWLLGKVHQLAGRPAAAEAHWRLAQKAIEKARADSPDAVDLIFWSANVHARLGDKAEAERELNLALQLAAGEAVNKATHIAAIKILLGRRDEALDLLETKLKTAAGPSLRNELRYDPAFDELRDNPRFQAIVGATR